MSTFMVNCTSSRQKQSLLTVAFLSFMHRKLYDKSNEVILCRVGKKYVLNSLIEVFNMF